MTNLVFEWDFTVLEMHLDTFGHMNHATYLQLFEQARWDFVTKRGYGIERIQETKVGPTILELNIRYMRELRLREEVKIKTQTVEFRSKIGKVKQVMYNKKGEACAEILLTLGMFDLKERRLTNAPTEWLHAIGVQQENVT